MSAIKGGDWGITVTATKDQIITNTSSNTFQGPYEENRWQDFLQIHKIATHETFISLMSTHYIQFQGF